MTTISIKERPILFQGAMVRALLDGTKTQTRRAAKHPLAQAAQRILSYNGQSEFDCVLPDETGGIILCPYGKPGDRLWVRETWGAGAWLNNIMPSLLPANTQFYYAATYPNKSHFTWRPSIHMPRLASRLLLEITAVRCERLKDISEADAWAEGCPKGEPTDNSGYFPAEQPDPSGIGARGWDCAQDWYTDLWEEINGPDSWEANPWVWVVEFKRVEPAL